MIKYRSTPLCLLLVTAFLLAAGASARGESIMSENKVPGQVESKARRLTHDLKKEGFEVIRGYFKLWTKDDCQYTADKMGTCYGNNPASPYVVSTLPAWPEEFVDKKYSNLWGPSQTGYHDVYRFDPREAIVILGQLPPPAAYFSEQTWLFTREGTYDQSSQTYQDIDLNLNEWLDVFFATAPEHPERVQVGSSLSNIVNNVMIERKSGSAFDQIRYFIITPDQFMDEAVRNALHDISVADEDVFTEAIPSDMNVGLDQSADDFTTWIRYAHPVDSTAADAWRDRLPMVVLRVRDTRSDRQPETYPPVELEERTAVDEHWLEPDLGSLLEAVARRWGQPCAETGCADQAESFIDMQTSPIWLVGPLCTEIGENCLLDTQDTAYQMYGPVPLDNGEVYAVAGTLGTQTGNATYVGLAINWMQILQGVANLSDELKDTANGYAGEVSNTDKFYLYYFTRDCASLKNLTGENCVELNDKIPAGGQMVLSIRDYIVPDTQRGPDSSRILPSMVLKLQRPE